MSKTIIEVKCIDQALAFVNTPVIASGGVGEDYVSAEFCEKWNGFAVSMLFWRQGVDPIPVLADADGLYQVPAELTTADGVVYFGAVGVAPDGVRRTSEGTSYRIKAGAITENTTLPVPDGDVFTQLLAQYADVKLYVSERVDVSVGAASRAAADAQACRVAAEEAGQHAEAAVDAVEDVIYPGIVEGYLDDGSNTVGITLSERPPDKIILSFSVPFLAGTTFTGVNTQALRVFYPGSGNGLVDYELFWVNNGWQQVPPSDAIRPGDVVTALFIREDDGQGRVYLLNPRITRTTMNAIADATWRTVTFIPYDGNRHTLAEAQAGTMLELPAEMDLTRYNYEYEILALGLTVTGQTSYSTNVPNITLHMDGVVKDRISLSLENTEEMENGIIPECDNHGYYLQQGIISLNQRRFWVSGKFWGINSMKEGYAVSRGYSDISEAYEYYSHIRLNAYAADTTQTYGLVFRYRPIPKE